MAIGPSEGANQDEGARIPSELVRSLKRNPSSLLIKGAAGTGKTTLALSMIRALGLKSDFLYLSTRASVSQILNDHSWMKDWLGDSDGAKEKGPHDPYLSPLFVDARLDEPTQLFEKITNQLMDARSPLIVVDAWDSLKELVPDEPLEADMRVLLAWCERANAKLVVTSEDTKGASLDPLVDCVVILDQKSRAAGHVRELQIPKLRGMEIFNRSYVFTLEGGVFHSFEPYRPEEFAMASYPSERRRRPRASSGRYPTGFRELDVTLDGGFRAGTLVAIELSLAADPRIALYLLGNVIADFALSNRPVIIESIEGLEPEFLDGFLKRSVPRTKLKYVMQDGDTKRDGERDSSTGARRGDPDSLVRREALKGPELLIMGSRALEQGRGSTRRTLEELSNTLGRSAGLVFIVMRSTERRVSERVFSIASSRMRVTSERGTPLIQPDARLPKLLGFDLSQDTRSPSLDLWPIE